MADNELQDSWYTKYRPKTIDDYCGDTIKNIVRNRFTKSETRPHCIYIKGPRGTGKTTIARILSKYYHCENPKEDGTPCEECEMCTQINEILIEGNSMDTECPGVIEVDATIANTKERIQEVIEDAIMPPVYTEFKIVIFDECHMISREAQNSLLKIIEDIPKHLVCMFCTTNDEKVLATVKSRMQITLDAKKQTVNDMVKRLEQISVMEKLEISREALEVIAKKEDRVPRECINALENVAKTYNNKVTIETVTQHYGGDTTEIYMEFFKAANHSLEDIMLIMKRLRDNQLSYAQFVNGLNSFVVDSLYIKHGISIEEYTNEYIKLIKDLFDSYTSSDFDMLLQIMEHLSNSLALDNDKKNEILLINTALRIGKINMLSSGLGNEQAEAVAENKMSLAEHSKKLKRNNSQISERLKLELDITDMAEDFEDMSVVKESKGILDRELITEIPEHLRIALGEQETVTQTVKEEDNFCDELQDFLNG